MSTENNREKLIEILQLAYSGELAAAYAYRGHWHSVSDEDERARIKTIEEEEWHHRRLVGEMLAGFHAGPRWQRGDQRHDAIVLGVGWLRREVFIHQWGHDLVEDRDGAEQQHERAADRDRRQ